MDGGEGILGNGWDIKFSKVELEMVVASVRTLAKQWGVSRRTAMFRVYNDPKWTKVDPFEVGSMKASVNVWKN